jgi:hypothetical protein
VDALSSQAGPPPCLGALLALLRRGRLPDLEKGLAAVHCRKVSAPALARL